MNDATTRACFLAVRERIKIINRVRTENSSQAEKAGLVSAYRVIDALARRYIKKPEWPGHEVEEFTRLLWEFEWYGDYCAATEEFCRAVQSAVKEKRLTLRKTTTRLPVDQNALDAWLSADLEAQHLERWNGFMALIPTLCPSLGRWPDNVCLPPTGALIPDEVTAAGQPSRYTARACGGNQRTATRPPP